MEVSYAQGEAFLLNIALLAISTSSQRLIPLTDREEHYSILRHKLRRGAKSQLEAIHFHFEVTETSTKLVTYRGLYYDDLWKMIRW